MTRLWGWVVGGNGGPEAQLGSLAIGGTGRAGISVDRFAVHPVDEGVGGKGAHAGGVPGEGGVVEEVVPLATGPAVEEGGGVDPMLTPAGGDGGVGSAAHRLERCRLDQAWPSVLVYADAGAGGQLPHLPLQVVLQVVVVQVHDIEVVGGVAKRLQVLDGAPQRRPDQRRRRLVVDPLPEAVPRAVGAWRPWSQRSELDAVDRCRPFAGYQEGADVGVVDVVVDRQRNVAGVTPDADVGDPRIVGYPIERRVGLEEPAVRLGLQVREHLGAGPGHHVDPRREPVQRERKAPVAAGRAARRSSASTWSRTSAAQR